MGGAGAADEGVGDVLDSAAGEGAVAVGEGGDGLGIRRGEEGGGEEREEGERHRWRKGRREGGKR